jgi:uncharacterized membrane protein
MDAMNYRLRGMLQLLGLAAGVGTTALMMVHSRSLAWASTRLAESGGGVLGSANLWVLAALPAAFLLLRCAPNWRALLIGLHAAAPLAALVAPEGRFLCIIVLAFDAALLLGAVSDRLPPLAGSPRRIAWAAFGLSTGVASTFALHRHYRFGSGAWDMGCFSHSSWLAANGEPLLSTVLHPDGVHVLGDHFYPIIVALAPLHWAGFGAAGLIVVQAAALAAVVFPFTRFLARRTEHPGLIAASLFALVFSFGFQSAAYFDFHAQNLALWPLAEAIDRLDRGRYKAMLPWLAGAWLCKENMPLYVGWFGLFIALFRPGARRFGAALCGAGMAGFAATVGWVQPALLSGGPQGMIHAANYAAFGSGMGEAVLGMASNPVRTLLIGLSPIEKRLTLLTTWVGVGLLAAVKPRYLFLALPTLVERFLSSKHQMWEMGYHYAAPLTLFVAFAAADALGGTGKLFDTLERFLGLRARRAWVVVVLAVLVNGFAYRHLSNFLTWDHDYFLDRAESAATLAMIDTLPPTASVEAMNHVLAHVADRRQARFLSSNPTADAVAFNFAQTDWLPSRGNRGRSAMRRAIRGLLKNPDYRLAFSQRSAVLFRREPGADTGQSEELKALIKGSR